SKSSNTTQANLLPSTSSVSVTSSSKSLPSIPSNDTTLTSSNSFYSSNKAIYQYNVSIFRPLPSETCPAVETESSISNIIPTTSQDRKQTSKSCKKRRLKRNITFKIDIQLKSPKPKKSTPFQDTSNEYMLIYDVEEEVESPKKNNSLGEIKFFWKNGGRVKLGKVNNTLTR
ncbi:hypothetical protein TNCV_1928101, partial [Trichonephila clavipes]